MPAAAVAGQSSPTGSAPAQGTGTVVPFFYGTNQYVEKFASNTQTLGATAVEFQTNINPGGFLRGVRLEVRSVSGVAGGGTLSGDAPGAVIASAALENIDGSPIVYPMNGFAHLTSQWMFRPWHGDPSRRFDYSASVNPAFTLFIQPELRQTAGVLANTDARALYRVRWTYSTLATLITGGSPTAPAVTVTAYMESWAQPDSNDLRGNPIEEIPPGLNLATLRRQQIINLAAAGADNTLQLSNMGNELRGILMITRNSSGVRTDLLSDPIRWRIDNRSLGVFSNQEVFNRMSDFYESLQNGSTRPTGVYVFPRFYQPGRMVGESWLATTNATYVIFESATATGGTSGTIQVITDEVVPVGPVPMELESI
jgi:hypothetical protein